MVFQEQSILPTLTVAENIFLGREQEFLALRPDLQSADERGRARRSSRRCTLDIDPGTPARELTFAERQMVEIAKALSLDSRIDGHITILLDEPTSVLEKREIELLF